MVEGENTVAADDGSPVTQEQLRVKGHGALSPFPQSRKAYFFWMVQSRTILQMGVKTQVTEYLES